MVGATSRVDTCAVCVRVQRATVSRWVWPVIVQWRVVETVVSVSARSTWQDVAVTDVSTDTSDS